MPITIRITDWEIPGGNDCKFNDDRPCPFLQGHEYCGNAYCKIERLTPLELSRRDTWKKTPTCRLRT